MQTSSDDAAQALARVLLVEDEPALAANYALALETAGFAVQTCDSSAAARAATERELPGVVILDIGLGREADAGFELCRYLRQRAPRLPILFLSARDDDLDVISGLRLGADDFLSKRISLAQLVARVQTLWRRTQALAVSVEPGALPTVRTFGALSLDTQRLSARWAGQTVGLSVTEFHLVHALAVPAGQVRSRAELMRAAGVMLDDQTITAHIKRVRRKFEALDPGFNAIVTVYGLGYRWLDDPDPA